MSNKRPKLPQPFKPQDEILAICEFMIASLKRLKRRGVIVAVSGGIDSSVCLGLATKALGPDRVQALLLPEHHSSSDSTRLAQEQCEALGVNYLIEDISPTLEALGCYQKQNDAIRKVIPNYTNEPFKLTLSQEARITSYKLVVEFKGEESHVRCPPNIFNEIIAATNHKQRVRKNHEYYHAEKNHYAVIGTPNLLEYELGFFVKSGDGIADIKPIAHLYKSQVYQIADELGILPEIRNSTPTTDTFGLEQSQEEFFFQAPYDVMDIVLWGIKNNSSLEKISKLISATPEYTERLIKGTSATMDATFYQRSNALTLTTDKP